MPCRLQPDGHAVRISYTPEPETGIKRRRRIVHRIDHERPCAGNRRDLGSIDNRVAQQSPSTFTLLKF